MADRGDFGMLNDRKELAVPWIPLNFRDVATVAVHAQQSVLTLAVKDGSSWRPRQADANL